MLKNRQYDHQSSIQNAKISQHQIMKTYQQQKHQNQQSDHPQQNLDPKTLLSMIELQQKQLLQYQDMLDELDIDTEKKSHLQNQIIKNLQMQTKYQSVFSKQQQRSNNPDIQNIPYRKLNSIENYQTELDPTKPQAKSRIKINLNYKPYTILDMQSCNQIHKYNLRPAGLGPTKPTDPQFKSKLEQRNKMLLFASEVKHYNDDKYREGGRYYIPNNLNHQKDIQQQAQDDQNIIGDIKIQTQNQKVATTANVNEQQQQQQSQQQQQYSQQQQQQQQQQHYKNNNSHINQNQNKSDFRLKSKSGSTLSCFERGKEFARVCLPKPKVDLGLQLQLRNKNHPISKKQNKGNQNQGNEGKDVLSDDTLTLHDQIEEPKYSYLEILQRQHDNFQSKLQHIK